MSIPGIQPNTDIVLPSPPFITSVNGLTNLRDAGGYRVQPYSPEAPRSVRTRLIFRSAETTFCDVLGRENLHQEGVRAVFDLRSDIELEGRKQRLGSQHDVLGLKDGDMFKVKHVPVFSLQNYDPESIAKRYKEYSSGTAEAFTRAYADILANAGPAYKHIFEYIRDVPADGSDDVGFLVHCSAGKDRTGVIVAMLLALAGVSDQDVSREYALTELGLEASGIKDSVIQHLVNGALKGDKAGAQRMVSAKKESMLATLDFLRSEYGGVEGYMKKMCGLSDIDITKIRRNLVVDTPAIL